MSQVLYFNELEKIVEDISEEWGIDASLKEETDFSKCLPKVKSPQNGIIAFSKRITFIQLLYHLIQKGFFSGNKLVNLNEKIGVALSIHDAEIASTLKELYCDNLARLLQQVLDGDSVEYDIKNTILFILYHELTHVRISQQPSFFIEKKEELSRRIESASLGIKWMMRKGLKNDKRIEEEIICDLEACKKLSDIKNGIEIKKTLSDIVHTINMINSVSNLRETYIIEEKPKLSTYKRLTHSKETNNSISRFVFIQNYWKDYNVLLNGKEIMQDIVSTAFSLSIDQETIDFCRGEYKKEGNGFFNSDRQNSKNIKKEICEMEESFVQSIIGRASH